MSINDIDNESIPLFEKRRKLTFEKAKKRTSYYLPVFGWLPKYDFKRNLLADIIAGLTVSFVIIPQGISYGALSFLDPIHGLYCAFLPTFIYALFGSSKHLSVGPEAVASLLVGQLIARYVSDIDDPETLPFRAGIAAAMGLLVGAIAFAAGLFRLGFLDSILSKATTTGFITAIACVIMTEQLRNLLGISSKWNDSDSPIKKLIFVFEHIEEAKWRTCIVGLSSLTFLFIVKFLKAKYPNNTPLKFFPQVFFVVIVGCLISWGLDLQSKGVDIYGEVKGGFQRPLQYKFPNFEDMIVSSFTIVIVGFMEGLVCAKKIGEKNNYQISPNRELVAIGVSNIIASIFGSYPSFGSFPRTKLNDSVGGKSQVSSVVTSTIVLFAILFLLPAFYYLPKTISASIVTFAAISLLEFENIAFFITLRAWKEIILALTTLAVTIGVSIDIGIFVSIGISLVLVVKEVTSYPFDVLGRTQDNKFQAITEDGENGVQLLDDILIIRFKEALFFARTGFLIDKLRRAEKYGTLYAHPSDEADPRAISGVVFDLSRMTKIDASSMKLFKEICEDYERKKIRVCVVRLRDECKSDFVKSGVLKIIGQSNQFNKVKDAVSSIQQDKEEKR